MDPETVSLTMSYLEPEDFNIGERGDVPFGNDEVELDNTFLLPMGDNTNIVVNHVFSTAIPDLLDVTDFQQCEGSINICQDQLENFTDSILDISSTLIAETSSSELSEQPEQKVTPSELYSNINVFREEMEKKINEMIRESVQLLGKDPREYHPFYLTVDKYLTIGQQHGFIPKGEDEGLKVWKKYDTLAVEHLEAHKNSATVYSGERSSYATYILTRKVLVDGKVVNQKRNEKERAKCFYELERKAKAISKEFATIPSIIRQDFRVRLKFFSECCNLTYPGDCLRMNNIWTKFCSDFGRESDNFDGTVILEQPKSQSKKQIVLKFKEKSPVLPAEEDIPNLPYFSSFSLPPSPLAADIEEPDIKYFPLWNTENEVKEKGKNTMKASKRSAKEKVKVSLRSNMIKQKSRDRATQLKKTDCLSSEVRIRRFKKRKLTKTMKRIETRDFKTGLIRREPNQIRFSAARKKLKLGLQRLSSTSREEEILSRLERKISKITRKLRRPYAPEACGKGLSSPAKNEIKSRCSEEKNCVTTTTPEFSMCDECGQTYRTRYLKYHKEAVHNTENKGMCCPLCPQLFKGGRLLWSHFLSSHMSLPDHLNPTKISMQVKPIVKNLPEFNEKPNQKDIAEVKLEFANPPWNCPHCDGKSFTAKASLQRHLHLVHGDGNLPKNKFVCPECSKTFKEQPTLTQHIKRAHQGLENRCDTCSRTFQTAGKLWKHKADEHGIVDEVPTSNGGSIQCEQCGEYCLQGKQYLNHVKNHHPDMLEMTIRLDQERRREQRKETKRQARLKIKLSGNYTKNNRGPVKCPICSRILAGHLYRHMAKFHEVGGGQIKTFCCPQPGCDKKYKSRPSLRVHISQSHDPVCEKIAEQQLINVLNYIGTTKRYQCTLCGFRSANKHECLVHVVAVHPHCLKDENESVKCSHCEETGRTEEEMRNHVKFAHPKMALKCPHPGCDMIILSPSNLQEHFIKDHGPGGTTSLRTNNAHVDEKRLRKRQVDKEWKLRQKLRGPKVGHGFRRTPRSQSFPCYRCTYMAISAQQLDSHVREEHAEAYWPCKNCSVLCYSERSRLFHEAVKCKVKKQRPEILGTVIAYDQITMVCPLCDSEMKANGISYHLRKKHGIIEDGDLWKCNFCMENADRKNFKTREYWLAHMDDCHGHMINLEELIEVAKKINSKMELDIEKMKTDGEIKMHKPHKRKIKLKSSGRKPNKSNFRQSRSGRTLKKRKKFDSDDSEDSAERFLDSSDDDADCKRSAKRKVTKVSLKVKQSATRENKINKNRKPVGIRYIKDSSDASIEEIMSNLPLKIRVMFRKQCTVHLERLNFVGLVPIKIETDTNFASKRRNEHDSNSLQF